MDHFKQGFQGFFAGGGRSTGFQFFLLATSTFNSLGANAILFNQKVAPGVHGVLDKIK